MKALIRHSTTRRPHSGEVLGVRLQACVPNEAGRKMIPTKDGVRATNKVVPSFRKPYLILESMDYANEGMVTEAEIERFKQRLSWEGFTEFEFVNAKGEVKAPGASLSPELKSKIDSMFQTPADEALF